MSQSDTEHYERLRNSYDIWSKHRSVLAAYRAKPGDQRRTPPPKYDAGRLFPELAERAVTTVRLHPRYGEEPPADASKLGGTFIWPADEPWPVCAAHGIPLVTVAQLRAGDFPEMPFPSGSDLFQLLWCPREHYDVPEFAEMPSPMDWANPRYFWRNLRAIGRSTRGNPQPDEAYYEYVPFPCRLMPERVTEFPSVDDLSDDLVQRINAWQEDNLDSDGVHYACEYEAELSVAYGTKIGGYTQIIQWPFQPGCQCGMPMEHMLTIASTEWNGVLSDRRWTPLEEQELFARFPENWADLDQNQNAISRGLWNPTGLMLGDGGHMQLFVCRHCGGWPIVPHIECS